MLAALIPPGGLAVLADATGTDVAILSVVSMAGGYLLLAGLWYFVFRDKSRDKGER